MDYSEISVRHEIAKITAFDSEKSLGQRRCLVLYRYARRRSRRNREEETRTLRMPHLTSGFKRKSNIKSFPIVAECAVFSDFSIAAC